MTYTLGVQPKLGGLLMSEQATTGALGPRLDEVIL